MRFETFLKEFPGQGWSQYQDTPHYVFEAVVRARRARDEVAAERTRAPLGADGPVIG